jgi:hypothetical protein
MGTHATTSIGIIQESEITRSSPPGIESPEGVDTGLGTPSVFYGLADLLHADLKMVELTAKDDTPNAWFWTDLRNGPLVIEVPPNVLCLINDSWYHWIVDLGITLATKGEGEKYLLLPPDYKGEVPAGYNVVRARTVSNLVVWRGFKVQSDPNPEANMVRNFTKIYSLASAQ